MRILHTSDWHLTEKLGSVDRVDVMLVSGDMFSQCTRWDEIERAVKDVNTIFKPYLLRGGTIVAISGNHDNEHLFSILRTTLDLALPLDTQQMGGARDRADDYILPLSLAYYAFPMKTGRSCSSSCCLIRPRCAI